MCGGAHALSMISLRRSMAACRFSKAEAATASSACARGRKGSGTVKLTAVAKKAAASAATAPPVCLLYRSETHLGTPRMIVEKDLVCVPEPKAVSLEEEIRGGGGRLLQG